MKIIRNKHLITATVLGALVLAAGAAPAQTTQEPAPIDRERLERAIEQGLPPVVGDDNGELVERLLNASMGTPISRGFTLDTALEKTVGRRAARLSAACEEYRERARGKSGAGACVAERGDAEGTGAYARLVLEDGLASGNITFLSRPEVKELKPEDLRPVQLADADVYRGALEFLGEVFGLDVAEIPRPPRGVEALPVSHLNIGFGHEERLDPIPPVTVQKVVHVRRAFAVEGIRDPEGDRSLPYIPAPGMATIAFDDTGVVFAAVENWQELRRDRRMSPRNAKSRKELVAEIADDLAGESLVDLHSISATLVMSSDWRETHGYLLPAIEVQVLPVARDLDQKEQNALAGKSTAGMVREYALVHRTPEELGER